MGVKDKKIEKVYSSYVSEYHLEMILLPFINSKIEEKENNIESKDNVIIIGNKDYIENTNRRIMQKNIEDLTIVDCYKFEDICNNMSEVADKYDFNLNTNGLQ